MTVIPEKTLDWCKRDFEKAREMGDDERASLIEYFLKGFGTKHEYGLVDRLDYLRQGHDLALKLEIPCWEIAFEYWITLLQYVNHIDALPAAIKLLTKANNYPYKACPVVAEIYVYAIVKYINYDPVGYAEKIREAVEYCLNDLDIYRETYDDLLWYLLQFEFYIRNHNRVLEMFPDMEERTHEDGSQLIRLYLMMAETYYHKLNLRSATKFVQDALKLARKINDKAGIIASLQWQITITESKKEPGRSRGLSILHNEAKGLRKSAKNRYINEYNAMEAELNTLPGFYAQPVRAIRWFRQLPYLKKEREPYMYARARRKLIEASLRTPAIVRWFLNARYGIPTIQEQLKDVRDAAQVLAKPEEYIAHVEKLVKMYM